MTFDASVPNAAKSPALFPPQNQGNMTRIQANFNQEHLFLNTLPVPPEGQGIHKQCTFINKSSFLNTLPAGNGVLYSKNDSFGTSQLFWWNGSTTTQLTPSSLLVTGHATVADGDFHTIFPNPSYRYQAYVTAGIYDGTTLQFNTNLNPLSIAFCFQTAGKFVSTPYASTNIPASFNGNDLRIRNQTNASASIFWTIIVNRIR